MLMRLIIRLHSLKRVGSYNDNPWQKGRDNCFAIKNPTLLKSSFKRREVKHSGAFHLLGPCSTNPHLRQPSLYNNLIASELKAAGEEGKLAQDSSPRIGIMSYFV